MRIQHNIMSMNAYRNYNGNTSALSRNLEKLSSGYRINRAGDDAAGLAISEKMRAQITGLETAGKNVKDGVSLVKTAEGAMQEVQDMLNRMVELATQSANGTYDNKVDRNNLQMEVDKLKEEIDRIADSANFNGIKLLDGSLGRGKLPEITGLDAITPTTTAATGNSVKLTYTQMGANTDANKIYRSEITFTDASGMTQKVELKLTAISDTQVKTEGGTVFTVAKTGNGATAGEMAKAFEAAIKENSTLNSLFTTSLGNNNGELTLTAKETGTMSKVNVENVTTQYDTAATATAVNKVATPAADAKVAYDFNVAIKDQVFTVDGHKFVFTDANGVNAKKYGSDVTIVNAANATPTGPEISNMADAIENKIGQQVDFQGTSITFNSTPDTGGMDLQIGDTSDKFNQMNVSIDDVHVNALKLTSVSIATQESAQAAVSTIKDAINKVSSIRGNLGATQNRLEHTQKNLSVMAENIQDAESTIRDTDVAAEMMKYTKNNILVQSAQAMLAQANQVPQGVLQLLQ